MLDLRLIFTCCHPALSLEARLALTLRALGGLEVPQLVRAFLTTEAAMYQRLVRAKRKIVAAGVPYRVPPDEQLPERLAGVLRVVYLLFNEGHTATAGDELLQDRLCDEAVRLARLLATLMADDAETRGLLALLLLTDARRPARTDDAGDAIGLDDQDRSRWDKAELSEGLATLDRPLRLGRPGPYQVQAAIAALHTPRRGRSTRPTGRRSPRSTPPWGSSIRRPWSPSIGWLRWPRRRPRGGPRAPRPAPTRPAPRPLSTAPRGAGRAAARRRRRHRRPGRLPPGHRAHRQRPRARRTGTPGPGEPAPGSPVRLTVNAPTRTTGAVLAAR